MSSPRKKLDELAKQDHSKSDDALFEFYDSLPPIDVKDILGKWRGSDFQTVHWGVKALKDMKWYGKLFNEPLDAYPLITYNDEGKLIANQAMNGNSTLWNIEFRGKVSATMVYDSVPIFDHFRKVDDKTVLGVMNGKPLGNGQNIIDNGRYYFFYLERIDEFPAPLEL